MTHRRHRPVRGQRGLRRGGAALHAGVRRRRRPGQRQRRVHRDGPSARRDRRDDPRDRARRAGAHRARARRSRRCAWRAGWARRRSSSGCDGLSAGVSRRSGPLRARPACARVDVPPERKGGALRRPVRSAFARAKAEGGAVIPEARNRDAVARADALRVRPREGERGPICHRSNRAGSLHRGRADFGATVIKRTYGRDRSDQGAGQDRLDLSRTLRRDDGGAVVAAARRRRRADPVRRQPRHPAARGAVVAAPLAPATRTSS